MEMLFVLLVVLITTRCLGEIAVRWKQPALFGELIAGIGLGAVMASFSGSLPVLAGLTADPVFIGLSDLGVFFLMLLSGVEMRARELARASAKSSVIALCGLLVPLATGFGVTWALIPDSSLKLAQCLFVGTALSITAVPVSIRVLMDLGQLETRVGRTIVSAAIIDDVISLILLAVLTGLLTDGGLPDIWDTGLLIAKVVGFFAIVAVTGLAVAPRMRRFVRRWQSAEFDFSSLLLAALVFGVLAELLALHFILGAFAAGLFFERRHAGKKTYEKVRGRLSAVTSGFLAPIFFASIGMHLDVSALTAVPWFLALLIVVAFSTKLIGAGGAAYLLGLSKRDACAVGVGMSARGAVELVIASIALRAGLFSEPDPPPPILANMFSTIVIVAVVTTVVSPFALKAVFGSGKAH